MEEIYKDIEGYEGLYQVSNLGNVKSLHFKNPKNCSEKVLKTTNNKYNYPTIGLYKDKKCKRFLVHRLVAKAFIPNPNNYPQINHKDETTDNNCVDNLEWCTQEYNLKYGTRMERVSKANTGKKRSEETKAKFSAIHKGKKRLQTTKQKISIAKRGVKMNPTHRAKINQALKKPIGQFNKDNMELIAEFPSIIDAANKLKLNQGNISKCCMGNTYKTVGGYVWRFL